MLKKLGSLPRNRIASISAAIVLVLTYLAPAFAAQGASAPLAGEGRTTVPTGTPIWAVQIDFTKPHDVPWTPADFATIAHSGINRVEINLDWNDLEPKKGQYDFHLLDSDLAGAAQAGIKLIPIFWESEWAEQQGKNPAQWVTARDLSSDGKTAQQPPWWDPASRQAYFDYMAHTIDHAKTSPGFGGIFADYGWLDAMWGPDRGDMHGPVGYAPADIQAFHRWLPQSYKTLAAFNKQWNTSFKSWADVPAAKPGDPLFAVYQQFRHYSVVQAYDEMSRLVRAHTNAPLYYYWGGGLSGRGGPAVLGNDPDTFFKTAKRYHAIVVEDDADNSGIALLFGSMARDYQVPLLEEWTPKRTSLLPEIPQWLGHIALGPPFEVGEDFFIYPPKTNERPEWQDAWNAYQAFHEPLGKILRGKTLQQPVAVLVPTQKIVLSTDLGAFGTLSQELTTFWRHNYVLPHFITDQEVADGVVSLRQFRAVVDLAGEKDSLPALAQYAKGHPVLTSLDQAAAQLKPYLAVEPATQALEAVPVVNGSSVWLTISNCDEKVPYSGTISFDPAVAGLSAASFSVSDVKTGEKIEATRTPDGKVQWHMDLPAASIRVLEIKLTRTATPLAAE
jgi:hypothetical protein